MITSAAFWPSHPPLFLFQQCLLLLYGHLYPNYFITFLTNSQQFPPLLPLLYSGLWTFTNNLDSYQVICSLPLMCRDGTEIVMKDQLLFSCMMLKRSKCLMGFWEIHCNFSRHKTDLWFFTSRHGDWNVAINEIYIEWCWHLSILLFLRIYPSL